MTILIDLRKLFDPLAAEIRNSLLVFSSQNRKTQICTVGLWGDGFHGTASLHLDTADHSAAFVQEWLKNGSDWYGQDDQGRYCNNCWDFPYCIGEYRFPGYPGLYDVELDAPVDYITLEGTTERAEADEGDQGKNRIVFPFLKVVLTSFQPFASLSRAAPFRVGVQMHESRYIHFWGVETGTGGSFGEGAKFRHHVPKDFAGKDAAIVCLGSQAECFDPTAQAPIDDAERQLVDRVTRLLVGPVWGPSGDMLTWVEDAENGGEPETKIWILTSDAERVEANRFFEAARMAGKLPKEDGPG